MFALSITKGWILIQVPYGTFDGLSQCINYFGQTGPKCQSHVNDNYGHVIQFNVISIDLCHRYDIIKSMGLINSNDSTVVV